MLHCIKTELHSGAEKTRQDFIGKPASQPLHLVCHRTVTQEVDRNMSLQEHVESLRAKHALLEEQIDEEQHRPMPDPMTLAQLKKAKLRLKEEIEKISETRH